MFRRRFRESIVVMFRPRKLPGGKEIWNKTKQTIQSIFLKFLERKKGVETNGKMYLDISRTFQVKLNEDCKCQFDQKRRPVCVFWRMSICRDWYWMILPHISLCPPSSIIILIVREGVLNGGTQTRPDVLVISSTLIFDVCQFWRICYHCSSLWKTPLGRIIAPERQCIFYSI